MAHNKASVSVLPLLLREQPFPHLLFCHHIQRTGEIVENEEIRMTHQHTSGGGSLSLSVNFGNKLLISCPLCWWFSLHVLLANPRERLHRLKKERCFQQNNCKEINSLFPKFTHRLCSYRVLIGVCIFITRCIGLLVIP